jgi:hypothetical protein
MSKNSNRRRHARQLRDERVVVQVASSTRDTLPPGSIVRCSTKDVSASGMRLQVNQRVPEGSTLELWVEASNHPTKFYLCGEVKWCRELDETERYLIGIELKDGETEDFNQWREALGFNDPAPLEKALEA